MKRAWLMVGLMIALSSCTVYFDVPVPSEDAPVDTAPFLGTWEGVSLAGEPIEDPVTVSLVEFGADLRFAMTAAQAEGGAEETIAGEMRLAEVDDQTYASARVEGTAGWVALQVMGPDGDELRLRPIAQAAMEQAVAAQVVSGTAQNSALGARGLFIHEDEEGLTRFLSENPDAFEDGTEVVLRRLEAGVARSASEEGSRAAGEANAMDQANAPSAVSQNPLARALMGTVAGVLIVAMLMVAFSSRGRRRK